MNQPIRTAFPFFAIFLVLGACSGKSPAESADQAAPAAQEPAAESLAAAPAEAVAAAPTETQQAATAAASAAPASAPAAPAAQPKIQAPAAAPAAVTTAAAAQAAPVETPVAAAAVAAALPEPAAAPPKARVAKDVMVLTGSPLGGVRFEHKLHAVRAGGDCSKCHHASRPEKAASAPHQACSECHSKAATPPMKTNIQGAFHNPVAQSGICIDCHRAENAKGKKAPLTCMECHKKENK